VPKELLYRKLTNTPENLVLTPNPLTPNPLTPNPLTPKQPKQSNPLPPNHPKQLSLHQNASCLQLLLVKTVGIKNL